MHASVWMITVHFAADATEFLKQRQKQITLQLFDPTF
jgi:hypothetical protein